MFVDVKDKDGKIVSKSINYKVNAGPLKINSITIDKNSPQSVGTAINIIANATGGSGVLKYRFTIKEGNLYTVLRDYTTSKTVKWTCLLYTSRCV